MTFNYQKFKQSLIKKYSDKLTEKEISDELAFEEGLINDKAPSKRLVVNRVYFKGVKKIGEVEKEFMFDLQLGKGLHMILADNFKGKSSFFKVIKYALTGDNDLAVDVKSWIKTIYTEFYINDDLYTAYLNLEGYRSKGALYHQLSVNDIVDKEFDLNNRVFEAESGQEYEVLIQDFFFKQFQFYHLNWTQKSSQKDKNELHEAKASWNTYYESIYLRSKTSNVFSYGNQEELIFQMLLGLGLTYPINRIKTKLEKKQFELAKLKDLTTHEAKRKAAEVKTLMKDHERVKNHLAKAKALRKEAFDLSEGYEARDRIFINLNSINSELLNIEANLSDSKQNILKKNNTNREITNEGNRYKELIAKAEKRKIALQEHIEFGIFFSNLDIKACPHCNREVTEAENVSKADQKECVLCSHTITDTPSVNKDVYQEKINALQNEIEAYNAQLSLLRNTYRENQNIIGALRNSNTQKENQGKELRLKARETNKELKAIETSLKKAWEQSETEKKILELEKEFAVLEYRVAEVQGDTTDLNAGEIKKTEYKIELLSEALDSLKKTRSKQNEEIINNFKQLLLAELHDLGISGITEVSLNDSFKISYNLNGNMVTFDKISEGEQLRTKIAFYLSLIQLDIQYNTGKHPRLLIIDSPNKEEGDQKYIEGLKKLLTNISQKYKEDLQIIIGTASRELEGAVPSTNTKTFERDTYLF